MATSRSSEQQPEWLAGASLFSGRPDPTWPIAPATARALVQLWQSLPETKDPMPPAPPLGYRGCFLRDDRGRDWRGYGGVVEHAWRRRREARQDPARSFERQLLASAPAGLLPRNLLE
jgi:hypothetical protein